MFSYFYSVYNGKHVPSSVKILTTDYPYTTRPLSRCYLRLYLVKHTAGAHKEHSKKCKKNLRTVKSKSYEQCRTIHEYYNNKAPHCLTAGLQIYPI